MGIFLQTVKSDVQVSFLMLLWSLSCWLICLVWSCSAFLTLFKVEAFNSRGWQMLWTLWSALIILFMLCGHLPAGESSSLSWKLWWRTGSPGVSCGLSGLYVNCFLSGSECQSVLSWWSVSCLQSEDFLSHSQLPIEQLDSPAHLRPASFIKKWWRNDDGFGGGLHSEQIMSEL